MKPQAHWDPILCINPVPQLGLPQPDCGNPTFKRGRSLLPLDFVGID
jgi:hypothetical protein